MAASTQKFWVGPDEDPNRYRLESHHSSGAEGEVWRGSLRTAAGTELDVAVKILHARRQDLIADWQARWTEQVELLRSLQYPGVIAVREAFEGDFMHPHGQQGSPGRSLYLIMNWVEGEPLHEWISRRPDRNVFESLRLLSQAAAALDYIHSGRATRDQPVVHRDVKPANIIVSDGQAVLVDFGLARVLTTTAPAGASGTSLYMAPEAFSSGQYSPASDRYSLGCVAYYVLTGEDPPKGHDLATMRARLAQVPAIGASPSLIRNVLAMLDPDPSKRPVTASTWVQLFQNTTLSQVGGKGLPPPPPDPTLRQTPRNPRREVTIGVAAAVVLLAAVIGFSLVGNQNDPPGTGPTTTAVAASSFTTPPPSTSTSSSTSTRPPEISTLTSLQVSGPPPIPQADIDAKLLTFQELQAIIGSALDNSKQTERRPPLLDPAAAELCEGIVVSGQVNSDGYAVFGYYVTGASEITGFVNTGAAESWMSKLRDAVSRCQFSPRAGTQLGDDVTRFGWTDSRGTYDLVFVRKGSNVAQAALAIEDGLHFSKVDKMAAQLTSRLP